MASFISTDEQLRFNRGCCFLVQAMLPEGFPFHQFNNPLHFAYTGKAPYEFALADKISLINFVRKMSHILYYKNIERLLEYYLLFFYLALTFPH